ncbi:hypothetical protein RQP46_010688 [Phenoliferia psychrophenolica]
MTYCVAILATGQMGASFGSSLLRPAGVRIVTNLSGRSSRTRSLAHEAGFEDLKTDAAILSEADIILSVLVPSQAVALAERLAAATTSSTLPVRTRFFADLNAIAPATARAVSAALATALPSVQVVDGGIVGGPATRTQAPLVVLSGEGAEELHEIMGGWFLGRTKVVGKEVGQASAMKLGYAALSKGTIGLALNVAMLADQFGVSEALQEELGKSQPGMLKIMNGAPRSTAKAFRWVGEMEEISAALELTGLGTGGASIFKGMAESYAFIAANEELGSEPIEAALEKNRSIGQVVEILAKGLKK